MLNRFSLALLAALYSPLAVAQVGPSSMNPAGMYNADQVAGNPYRYGVAPPAGSIFEEVKSSIPSGSAVPLTSATPANITSVSLSAGNWLCSGHVDTAPAGSTTTSLIQASLNTTSATHATAPNDGAFVLDQLAISAGLASNRPVGSRIYRSAAALTVYLVATINFGVSTMGGYGSLSCQRLP